MILQEIDESHPVYGNKYLKNKQVKDLLGDQYLKLVQAEKDKLIEIKMSIDMVQGSARSVQNIDFFLQSHVYKIMCLNENFQ